MARFAPLAALALLGSIIAGPGCASSHPAPCSACDGGQGDEPDDAPVATADVALPGADGPREARPDDLWAAEAPAPRDVPAGEAQQPTPLPDAGYLFTDDFQNPQAPGWQIVGVADRDASMGGWSVILGSSGSVLAQGLLDQNTWHIVYATASIGPDQIVEARLRVIDFYAPSPAYVAALFARYDPVTDSGYLFALRGDGSVTVRRRAGGTTSSWGNGTAAGIRAGVWYTVRLEVVGNAINAFLDGQLVYSVSDDTPLPRGGLALGTLGATMEVDRASAAEP